MVGFFRCMLFLIFFIPVLLKGQTQLYEKENVIRIKFKESYVDGMKPSTFSRTAQGYVKTGLSPLDMLNEQFGALEIKRVFSDGGKYSKRRRDFGLHLWYEVHFDVSKVGSVQKLLDNYSECIAIQQAEPLYSKSRGAIPGQPFLSKPIAQRAGNPGQNYVTNDPQLAEQWHYNNTGQTGGTSGSDIKLFSAWDLQKGSPDVIVSIHDGGIDVDHADIAGNMWANTAELNGTAGVDDDNNGYIDDVNGYNLADDTGNILADDHGTHVAGTVAAVNNNGIGVAGVAGGDGSNPGAQLMSCQVFGYSVGGFAESYAYAADNGAVISQNSWGYTYPDYYEQSILDAIDYFIANAGYDENGHPVGPMQGGMVIFAAGNSDSNAAYYPGYYDAVLSVASTNHNDEKAFYSNYGSWVDVSAPGGETTVSNQGVLSTLPNNTYGFFQGTSMACPHVSGVAALIVSQFGGAGFTPEQLRYRLAETTDDIDGVNSSYTGQLGTGRINAFASLLEDDGIAPDEITDLDIAELRHNQITVSWTAPADEDNISATSYEIRYSMSPITADNFETASLVGNRVAQSHGAAEAYTFENLSPQTSYYFAIKSHDFFSNASNISNVLNATTTGLPVMEVSPLSLTSNLYVGESEVQQINISNTGEGVLEYSLSIGAASSSQTKAVLQQSEVFKGLKEPLDKGVKSPAGAIFTADRFESAGAQGTQGVVQHSSDMDLELVLDSLNNGYGMITSLVPDYYSFYDGETGYDISDGGNDMYDGGNTLGTDAGNYIYYSNKAITTSTYLNDESYFTAKYPGLFVFAADLNGQSYFEINGDLGADGSGSVDGAVLSLTKDGRSYLGFVKRVYDAWDPSVNHLIIVEDNGSVNHEFSTYTNSDYHRVSDLAGIERMYYLLFAGTSGSYISNEVMLEIMDQFISLSTGSTGMFLDEFTGTVSAGETEAVDVRFDALNLSPGQYNNSISITSNASDESVIVTTELTVEGAAHVTSDLTALDFGNVFIDYSSNLSFYLKNTGNEDLIITSISASNSAYVASHQSATIIPEDSLLVSVDFSPTATGTVSDHLTIVSNDPNDPSYQISLVGAGQEPPKVVLTPDQIVESLLIGESSTRNISIFNSGNGSLQYEMYVSYEVKEGTGARQNDTYAVGYFADMSRYNSIEKGAVQFGKGDTVNIDNSFLAESVGMTYVDGYLYAVSYFTADIVKFDAFTNTELERFSIHEEPYGIAWDGTYLWVGDYAGNVFAYDLNGSQQASFSCPFSSYPSITWDGERFVVNEAFVPTPSIYKLDVAGNIMNTYSTQTHGGYLYSSVYVDKHDNGTFWGLDPSGSGRVIHYRLVGQNMSVISQVTLPFGSSWKYSIAHNGMNLLIADWYGNLVEIEDGIEEHPWLTLSSTVGGVEAQASDIVGVTLDANELEAGAYSAVIKFISNDPERSEIEIPVSLRVCDATSASPPEIINPVVDQVMDPDDGKLLIDMESVFNSASELIFTGYGDNPAVAEVNLYGPILSIDPVQLGQVGVTIAAYDNECGKMQMTFKVSIEEITAVEDEIAGADIKVYPNPMGNSGGVIEFVSNRHGIADISLLDINGREIQLLYSGEIASGMNMIEISSGLQSGFYLIKIAMDEQSNLLRLMIK